MLAATKSFDSQGRLLIPKEIRGDMQDVNIIKLGNEIRIIPKSKKSLLDLPPIKADLNTPLDDWKAVKKELLMKKYETD